MNLSIQNVSKKYANGTKALDGLNLEISDGMFGLLGPNGAGKSTLMRTIATLQVPDQGAISFGGSDIMEDKTSFRRILGYLPQDFGVYEKDSAEQLLSYFAVLKGISSRKDRRKKVAEVLHLTNLWEVRKRRVSKYSGGMLRRFGIAQLLLNDPKVIVVDEPTAGLDPAERTRFLNLLREIGYTNIVLISTHLVEDVKELCSDMAIMNRGKVVSRLSPREALTQLKGKIWSMEIDRNQSDSIKERFNVLSESFTEQGRLLLRVYSEDRPMEAFSPCEPVLGDHYFRMLKK